MPIAFASSPLRTTAFVQGCPQPQSNPLDDFDPNAPEIGLYATYCFQRARGSFKVHARRQDALAALRVRKAGVYYEHDGTKWVEKARVNPPEFVKETCDRCGGSTVRHPLHYIWRGAARGYKYVEQTQLPKVNQAVQKFERDSRDKLVYPVRVVVLCPDCA